MKEKQRIIDEGGTPYESIKDENGKVIGDNGGEHYFVYLTDDTYYWLNLGHDRKLKVGINKYKFIPFRSFNYRRQRKIKENESIKLRYATY